MNASAIPKRDLLRHTVATLAYRGGKTVREAPAGFGTIRIGERTRTPVEILAHIGDLLDWALSLAKGQPIWNDSTPLPWEQEVTGFFSALQKLEPSVHFYQKIFGFEVIDVGERLYALGVQGRQTLLLFKKGVSTNLALGAHHGNGELHLAFAIPNAELVVWEDWLVQQGVIIEHRRVRERGGHSLYCRDPDRHLIELATPGVWSMSKGGGRIFDWERVFPLRQLPLITRFV